MTPASSVIHEATVGNLTIKKQRQLRFTPIGDAIKNIQPLKWIIDGVLPDGISCIVAPPASAKSFLQASIAIHVAAGQDWFGHKVNQGNVCVINAEGNMGYSLRLLAASIDTGIRLDSLPLFVSNTSTLLNTDEGMSELIIAIKQSELKPNLIIIDTLARSFNGDENGAKDMGELIIQLDKIRFMYDCSILLVHHTGKDPRRGGRGSNALFGALDAEIKLARKSKGFFQCECTKMKEAEPFKGKAFSLKKVCLPNVKKLDGSSEWSATLKEEDYKTIKTKPFTPNGKNQRKALKVLKSMMETEKNHLNEREINDEDITVDCQEWLDNCELGDRRIKYTTKKSLVEKNHIHIDELGQVKLLI